MGEARHMGRRPDTMYSMAEILHDPPLVVTSCIWQYEPHGVPCLPAGQ